MKGSRRDVIKGLGAVAVMVASGCKSSEQKPEPKPTAEAAPNATGSTQAAAKAPEKPKAGPDLNLFAWSEYVPQEVLDGFTKETKIKVNYETYASNEEMLSKLLAGGTKYDLIQPSEYVVEGLVKQNKLEAVDWSLVPNIKNIADEYKKLPHDPEQKYSVPWLGGGVSIVVNTAKIKDPIKGYKDVFQTKYKGRICVVNDNRELTAWALAVNGLSFNNVTPETLAKIKPTLAEWMKLIKVFDSDSPKTAFLNGDVDLGVIWSGEAALLYQQDKKFQPVVAEEGSHLNIDSLVIPTGAPNKVGAMMFMDYILRPEVSKLVSEKFPYTNPNLEARKLLTPEQLGNPASYPPPAKRETFRDIGKAAADIDKLVTDLKAAN
ncbi:MAG TPA: spermidine/putrescine ABC transporter substrate-binding protein [Polyangium sp.]|nr:spermidine/putrescine ABC transporter substrate-binding protein [Polyangium sp.]